MVIISRVELFFDGEMSLEETIQGLFLYRSVLSIWPRLWFNSLKRFKNAIIEMTEGGVCCVEINSLFLLK
jgi:hypothetical protein